MSGRTFSIAAALLVVSVLIFVHLLGVYASDGPTIVAIAPTAAPPDVQRVTPSLPQIEVPVNYAQPEPASPAAVKPSPSPAKPSSGSDPTVGELPLRLRFQHRADLDNQIEGSITSMSSDALTIDVHILTLLTQQTLQTRLQVPPQGQASFGLNDGLELHTGDQVTLLCAGFTDLVQRVR